MSRLTDIEILRDLLSYDTEELKFLTFYERCEIQRNISRIIRNQETAFSPKLESRLIEKIIEIMKSNWKRPEMHWEIDNYGKIVKGRLN